MKTLTLITVLVLSLPVFANRAEMQTLIQITNGNIYGGQVPAGYTSTLQTNFRPTGKLKAFIARKTQQKQRAWRNFVLTSGEYQGTAAELERIAANPLSTLEVATLLEVSEVYAIYKDGQHIGYHLEIIDFVQSQIYQDGAWYELFIDEAHNVVKVYEESA